MEGLVFLLLIAGAVGAIVWLINWDKSRPESVAWRAEQDARRVVPGRLLPWYELPGDVVALHAYASPDLATRDANLAAPFGWSVQSVTTSDGHVNVGRTVSGAVLTGGISLLLGGSRTKGAVTVTYTRQAIRLVEQAS